MCIRDSVCAIKKLQTNCGLFICNLGTGHGYSVLDVIHAFEKACGKQIPYVCLLYTSSDTINSQYSGELQDSFMLVKKQAQALLDSVNQLIAVVNEPEIQQALIDVRDGLQRVVDKFNETGMQDIDSLIELSLIHIYTCVRNLVCHNKTILLSPVH